MKVDAEKGEGMDLAQRYHITGYPTIIFTRATGGEVDRIIGYLPPDRFLEELDRITSGKNTLESIRAEIEQDPQDLDAFLRYGWKLDDREVYSEAIDVWRSVQLLSKDNSPAGRLGDFKVAEALALADSITDPLDAYLEAVPKSEYTAQAMQGVVQIYRSRHDFLAEATGYKQLVDYSIQIKAATPRLLNSYAWRMTQLEQNLEDALERIRLGVELAAGDEAESRAGILDTEAEVLWKLGRVDEALEVITMCIKLQPEDSYFQDQKAKFEASRQTA
ncbi:MAG: hypothetical protein IIB43_05855 [Candidatus Marinimicrobia bacterium]|nr:hypothetical protein [Candidatus Neomarinimicrobiota bacterium]